MKTLKDAKVGETLTVMKLQGTGAIKDVYKRQMNTCTHFGKNPDIWSF